MHIDTDSGRLDAARFVASPNCDDRPEGAVIDTLLLHGISLPPGEYGGPYIEALFTNTLDLAAHPWFEQLRGLEVSAHLLIRRDGSLMQFVPFHKRAWHAGESFFLGRQRCNDFSIGIELEGSDDDAYADAQYETLLPVTRTLMSAYPALTPRHIAAHSDVAPGRKTDPGPAFDWFRLYDGLVA